MNIEESIHFTKIEFEKSFESGTFYNKQTQDERHLEQIIDILPIQDGMRILDLGVGSGYLSFPIAKQYPTCQIVGLDIVEKALQTNQKRAEEEQLNNISFVNYDGMNFPFENNSFDLVITRYALHHFPNIKFSLSEVKRVLKPEGHFFLSDPRPNNCDNTRFVDEYMQLKKDGHIKFYTKQEWIMLYAPIKTSFNSSIRFPKKKDTAYGYEDVLKRHDPSIIQSYELEETETEIYVTEQVNNILFFSEIESKIFELEK